MNGSSPRDIRTLTLPEIEVFLAGYGEKKFRAKQVYEWLWKKSCRSFSEMTSLSSATRQLLKENFLFSTTVIEKNLESNDGTLKVSFRFSDGVQAEGVLIPAGDRATACISSQAGCKLGCRFCATGLTGFSRDLTAGEIYDQVVLLSESCTGLSNIVFMGMGEPLLNYNEVTKAIQKITGEDGLGISPRRITISTVGIPEMIRKLADDGNKCHLALSLHAATDEKRNLIIPVNKKYPLTVLTEALKYYHKKTEQRISIEYILFRDFNDSIKDAADLASFCRSFPVKVNLIEYNAVENTQFQKSDPGKVRSFISFLERKNMVVNLRKSRGADIFAACGQLALQSAKKERNPVKLNELS